MSLDPSKQSRFGGSKVRTGCLTCLRRHLKCDEHKPSCLRCSKSGRECQQRPSEEPRQNNATMRMVHYVSPRNAPSTVPGRAGQELRYLEYFRLRTAPELSGVNDPQFWAYHVLQIAIAEPAIWHATIALASLHEHFETSATLSLPYGDLDFPMGHYGRAISLLCAAIKDGTCASQDTPLLACALFSAFESMGYHLHSALSHITSGLKVLEERKRDSSTTSSPETALGMLIPLFKSLDTQRLELGDSSFPPGRALARILPTQSTPPTDLNEARIRFDEVFNSLLHHIKHAEAQCTASFIDFNAVDDTPDDGRSALRDAVTNYLSWTAGLEGLLDNSNSSNSARDMPSALLLQLWRLFVNIMLRVDLREGEVGFDRFHTEFELMVSLMEEFICHSAQVAGVSNTQKTGGAPQDHFDEPLPDALYEKRTRPASQAGQQSGFMGVRLERVPMELLREASRANERATRLLHQSKLLRPSNPDRLSSLLAANNSIKPTFTFSPGIIYPLYTTVNRCRDPTIRRRAWNLMHKCNRREGVWDSALAAKLGQRIIRIEESQALLALNDKGVSTDRITSAVQIPNVARIRMVRPTFLPNRRSIERYFFGWPCTFETATEYDEVWIEEELTW